MAAFARDLAVSPSLLSRIMKGSRPITFKMASRMVTLLELSDEQSKGFINCVLAHTSAKAKITKKAKKQIEEYLENLMGSKPEVQFLDMESEGFKSIAQWYHLGILNLISLQGFQSDPLWIAGKLGVSPKEAEDAIERLFALNLIKYQDGKICRNHNNLRVEPKNSIQAVRSFHKSMIEKALLELEKKSDTDFQRRLINGITFSCSSEKIEKLKVLINQFEEEILKLVDEDKANSVYQMNIQLFPLSRLD